MITENGSMIEVENDGTVYLNGSNFGSLIKIAELVNRMNSIESAVDGLVSDFNSHIHTTTATIGTGPAGVITPPTAPSTESAGTTTESAIENDKVQHGG